MEIILKQDIALVGHKDELITVKDGYARNYLIPKGFAILATKNAKKIHAENLRQRAHKIEKMRNEALELAEKMKGLVLKVGAKTSSLGKIFGSVNTIMLAEELAKLDYIVDRKNIRIKGDTIKEVGTYDANIRLFKDVKVDIKFEVVSE